MDDEDAEELGQQVQVGQDGDAGVVLLPLWDLRAGIIISQAREAGKPARP